MYVQSSLDFLGEACQGHPQLRVKIAVDCVAKGYATHEQAAHFVGMGADSWEQFFHNFSAGDVRRIPAVLRRAVPHWDHRFLTGFSDEQLDMIDTALHFWMKEQLSEYSLRSVFLVWEKLASRERKMMRRPPYAALVAEETEQVLR